MDLCPGAPIPRPHTGQNRPTGGPSSKVEEILAACEDLLWVNANPRSAATLIVKYNILDDPRTAFQSIPGSGLEVVRAGLIMDQIREYLYVFYTMNPEITGGKCPMRILLLKHPHSGFCPADAGTLESAGSRFQFSFIIPHPETTFLAVIRILTEPGFLVAAGNTILRGVAGFLLSGILGVIIEWWPDQSVSNTFITPMLVTVRSVPVISLILLALIWFNPGTVLFSSPFLPCSLSSAPMFQTA